MGVMMWHPVTDGTFEAPDDAVSHYRQSGWLLLAERIEHENRMAERATAAEQPVKKTAKSDGEGK